MFKYKTKKILNRAILLLVAILTVQISNQPQNNSSGINPSNINPANPAIKLENISSLTGLIKNNTYPFVPKSNSNNNDKGNIHKQDTFIKNPLLKENNAKKPSNQHDFIKKPIFDLKPQMIIPEAFDKISGNKDKNLGGDLYSANKSQKLITEKQAGKYYKSRTNLPRF